ncbi:MAG TPA: peptide chain release factor N(5)-glutamine methyltransferase [Solirubrobacterales bacterium]|jgi:release factor glutamine methyltransferase|nr:peptide chain release factor N(5)-glutamine methyltransferase [Solirubrobacterales bacterium]
MATTVGASVRDALGAAVDALKAAGVEDPRLDAELLLGEAMGYERAALVADPGAEVPAAASRKFAEMVRRRLRREPVAYILGRKGFRNIELMVDRRVLIPRPETELLVELALELCTRTVLDVGTGSGAIALAVADELPEGEVTATDTSLGALEVARANAERLGLADRVRFVAGMLPSADEIPDGGYDLVLANLPYVAERDWPALEPELTQWEPCTALLAGPDGFDAYRDFIPQCGRAFNRYTAKSSAALAVEVGEGQAPAVAELMRAADFGEIETRRDLAGIERVVIGRGSGAAPGGRR